MKTPSPVLLLSAWCSSNRHVTCEHMRAKRPALNACQCPCHPPTATPPTGGPTP